MSEPISNNTITANQVTTYQLEIEHLPHQTNLCHETGERLTYRA